MSAHPPAELDRRESPWHSPDAASSESGWWSRRWRRALLRWRTQARCRSMPQPAQRSRCRKTTIPASSCGHLQIIEHHRNFCLGFLLQKLHQLAHFRVHAFAQTQGEEMPPLADIRLHNDVRRRGVGQDLPRVLRLQPFLQQEVIGLLCI